MSSSSSEEGNSSKKYRGVRCRKWGKWVSEIRVPGTHTRLWLGSYATPEAAATAYDIASYCLKGSSVLHKLNFDLVLPDSVKPEMSPADIQRAASDAGMAVDARLTVSRPRKSGNLENEGDSVFLCTNSNQENQENDQEVLNISVDDYL